MGDLLILKDNRMVSILTGLFVLAFTIVFFSTWQSLFHSWLSSEDYSHGFLIVPLSLYVFWKKKEDLQMAAIKPSWLVFPLVIIALFLYVVAQYAEILTLAPLSMILFIGSSLFFLFGAQVFKICSFPLLLLLFMIPVPAQIYAALTIPLQLFVTKVTAIIAFSMGVPVLREGNVLYLPEHTLQVVQACSGLRSIMALMVLGVIIGYFSLQSNVLRSLLSVAAVPIAVLVNIARVLLMILAFYYLDLDLGQGAIHTVFGVIIFCLAFALFVLLRKGLVLCEK